MAKRYTAGFITSNVNLASNVSASGIWSIIQIYPEISGNRWPEYPLVAEYLVVAGGGGSGYGGGGAGGLLTASGIGFPYNKSYTITIGAGGSGGVTSSGSRGGNSSITSANTILGGNIIALGGGFGGGQTEIGGVAASPGGSGGGGGYGVSTSAGLGTSGQGFGGGAGAPSNPTSGAGGGGGGATAVGTATLSPYTQAGNGGAGLYVTISGSNVVYAGGGGGTTGGGPNGIGGAGGANAGSAGNVNTGGGAGGGGLAGGSGVVILAYEGRPRATGGLISLTSRPGYTVHTFNSTDTFQVAPRGFYPLLVDYLVVAAGGGGGDRAGGGGGGGAALVGQTVFNYSSNALITIGAGGTTIYNNPSGSNNGSNSSIGTTIIAIGGGGGGSEPTSAANAGGSGGGGGGVGTGGAGRQGFGGGNAVLASGGGYSAGGGGGMTQAGVSGTSTVPGNGGAGLYSTISGSNVMYGYGGGGSFWSTVPARSLDGAGQTSGGQAGSTPGVSSPANRGGGGGGSGYGSASGFPASTAGTGGSGITILAYQGAQVATGGTVDTTSRPGYTIHTFTSTGRFYYDEPVSIVTSNLIVHTDVSNSASWPGSGSTLYDISGNNYNFSLTGSPTYSSTNGGYLSFNGSTQYGRADVNNIIRTHPAWTFNTWFYYSATTSGGSFLVMTQPSNSDTNDGYWQHFNIGGSWLWRTEDNSAGELNGTYSATPFSIGNWYLVSTVVKTNSLAVYINGSLHATASPTFAWANLRTDSTAYLDMALGYAGSSNYYFQGYISHLSAYNKELSSTEIRQCYNALRVRYNLPPN